MTRRLEAGPLLLALGALLLLVSLFLAWFAGEVSAWQAFEVWDLVLAAVALASIGAGIALVTQDEAVVDRRPIPAAVLIASVIVAAQIIDPPPAAAGQDPDVGAWLALGAVLVMCAGAVLIVGRVRLAVTVEGRDPRQRVSAVDARGSREDTTTGSHEPVRPAAREGGKTGSLFGSRREPAGARPAGDNGEATQPMEETPKAGIDPPEAKQG